MQYNFLCDINFSARCFFQLEGADILININLDDRYEVIKTLQQSAATAVVLVRHKKIGALRILKAISKASPDAHSILSEAHLLQGFNSTLLPTIYEVEEDDEVYYLIEEYIDGISLREYLLSKVITKDELIKFAIEICSIVELLHKAEKEPILYLDMKPDHLIIQQGRIRLIDFGISVEKSKSRQIKPHGTPNWAAPEQLRGDFLDERCDIYAVGKVIDFMRSNSYAKDDFKLAYLIEKATAENVELRTKSISLLKEQLIALQGSKGNEKLRKKHLEKRIAVVGANTSVGTTHIAISLCRFFNKRKIDTYYQDIRENTVNHIWKSMKSARLEEGVLYHDSFRGIMNYGDAIEKHRPPVGLRVIDCGKEAMDILLSVDIIIYVISGRPWQQVMIYPPWIKEKNVYIINNFSNKITSIKKAKELVKRVYMYPLIKNHVDLSKEEEKVFTAIFKNEKDYIK